MYVEADPGLRGGRILVREHAGSSVGPWQVAPRRIMGLPANDRVDLKPDTTYDIRVERRELWTIRFGEKDEFFVNWRARNPFTEGDALLAVVNADPVTLPNTRNILLYAVLPGFATLLGVVGLVVYRLTRRGHAVETAARAREKAADVLAERILSKTKVPLPSSMQIASYTIVDLIGEGGMASVYKVEDELGQQYAMKIPHWAALQDPTFNQRFGREISICVHLQHPHIVRTYYASTYDPGDGRQIPFMVMELLDGRPVDALLKDRHAQRLPPDVPFTLRVGRAVAEALTCAHSRGVIHRDIKPGNVMITSDGSIKVLDFGIARVQDAATITSMTVAFGTPAFMAPEQIESTRHVDHRADLYSLGVLMYSMLTYRIPFDDDDPSLLLMRKMAVPPTPPSGFNAAVPQELEQIILKLLKETPDQRYQTAEEVVAVLDDFTIRTSLA
ncbi:MAG: serine/threonine-protein kinase [Candidatus Xenobia bacterium]